MRRREFIALFGGCAAWPALASAQQAKRKVRLGVLVVSNPEPFLAALKEGLRSFGYIEGQNLEVELRSAQGKSGLLAVLAAELVRLKVDVLVAWQTPAAQAVKQASATIPIVVSAGDPVG